MRKTISKTITALLLAGATLSASAQKTPQPVFGTWGHGQEISPIILRGMPFIRGWNFTFAWRDIEPEKGKFNWKTFDEQLKMAADNGLYIGFMIWVGQNSPEWIYTQDGVPKVEVNDDKHDWPYFPYYFSEAYKADYHNLLAQTFAHLRQLPAGLRSKVLFWMSAEGTTGDESPYKGTVADAQYDIPMSDWAEFKKGVWSYLYSEGKKMNPQLNILINQANNGMYLDWLLQNTPDAWFKAGSLAHTYSFTRELDYYNRLKPLMRPANNGMTNRFRSESEELQQLGWFQQSPAQNTFALVSSALTIGLDMMNVRKNAVAEAEGDYSFNFFNRYAGQRDPATAPGAFCVLRDVLDVADTLRFPVAVYGPVAGGKRAELRQPRDVNPARIQAIVQAFAAQGAQAGPSAETEQRIYADDASRPAKLRKNNLRPDLQDKYNSDIGINLLPDNYGRFLTQWNPNGTSKGYWRVGPVAQPYGRYARGFDHAAGMNEMWFALDPYFYGSGSGAHKVKLSIAYFDKGKGSWSLHYAGPSGTNTEACRVQCRNSGKWVVKEIELANFSAAHTLEHGADLSLRYESGDDTLFSLLELTRL